VLLLIHGYSLPSISFYPLAHALEDHYHIIAPDCRGRGLSSAKNPPTKPEDIADDLNLFMNALNIKKFHFLGLSAGGPVAFDFAVKYKDSVDKLILLAPASPIGFTFYFRDEKL